MSKMTDYYIDLWNAAFELKSISVKWEKDVDEVVLKSIEGPARVLIVYD